MRKIILASGSPRRRELLQQMGVQFEVVPSDYDEQLDDTRTTDEVAIELGLGKALTVAEKYPDALVIGSDTIVTLNGKQLGKPADPDEAFTMLRAHAGQAVTVTTSIVLVCKAAGIEETDVDTAHVLFKPYQPDAMGAYLKSGDWHDKAGGWGIQSGAAPLIDHISGSYDTILGLPTHILVKMLQAQGITARPVEVPLPEGIVNRA
ncbi:MAG TPA: Maf family protein [Patescibacteria group bacterium]|nr:Maf family protein [Patescibacteria group bacterium]